MRIRRFVTADMRAAIRKVREELGRDAVILSNRRTAQGVEVTAAVDYEVASQSAAQQARESAAPASALAPGTALGLQRYLEADGSGAVQERPPRPQAHSAVPPRPAASSARADAEAARPEATSASPAPRSRSGPHGSLNKLNREIRSLRGMLEHQLANLTWSELERRHPVRSLVMRELMRLGLSRGVAGQIAEAVNDDGLKPRAAWYQALRTLSQRVLVKGESLIRDGGVVALLGPTGVGKTTTVAKLAARFAINHGSHRVALITTDSYRIGAHEQLRTFGRIIDIPVQVANDEQELKLALERFSDRRLVLIDTAGMSQRDVRFSEQIKFIATGSPVVQNYLVLSATSQLHSLHEALRAFAGSHVDGCVITKIDECTSLGPVLSAVIGHATPVAYISNGQRVPEDLRPAKAGRLVELAVEIAQAYASADELPLAASAGSEKDRGV